MFEFLFKYPASLFSKGEFVLLSGWPVWLLIGAVVAAAAALAWHVRRNHGRLSGLRPAAIWGFETALVALLLFMLWHPALSVATLRPQQNIVAVLVDDSRSMAIREGGSTRLEQASVQLGGGVLDDLSKKFQVRLYRMGGSAERIQKLDQVKAGQGASRIGESLKQVMAESATLPLGAVLMVGDGADNSGGIDLETISEIRRRRIPVHTIGVGRERPERDIEVDNVETAPRALVDSRLTARVSIRHFGLDGQSAKITVREGGKVLAQHPVALKGDGQVQTETVMFNAGAAGPKNIQFTVETAASEDRKENNTQFRLVNVENNKPRILYIEGEPRWEFKFIRRALEEDRALRLVSILRTTQNKFYRQGIDDAKELEQGFPAKAEELFAYQALIVGDVEAGYFTAAQQELIKEFANRRGGGVLFLGGRATLSDGGYARSPLAEMLPVRLSDSKGTFRRDPAAVELTPQGRDATFLRLVENPERNAERWKKMPPLADHQLVGELKPGAVALLDLNAGGRKAPLLTMQNYGRGRVAVLATSGTWRWQMLQDVKDLTHESFWQQLVRQALTGTPGQVVATTPRPVLNDDNRVQLRVEARDKTYQPLTSGTVEARIMGPEGVADTVSLTPDPVEEGVYRADYSAEKQGAYLAEVSVRRDEEEIGRDVLTFRRDDGVAENFHSWQNRELLEKLAEQTGGKYWKGDETRKLATEISYSEAGITTRETRDLWNMPIVFLIAFGLRAGEWLLRRRWGVV